ASCGIRRDRYVLDEPCRCALYFHPRWIERRTEQRGLIDEYQVSGRQIASKVTATLHGLSMAGFQIQRVDIRFIEIALNPVTGEEDHIADRENLRPAVGQFAFVARFREH